MTERFPEERLAVFTLAERPDFRAQLFSAEFAAAAGDSRRLEPLGYHRLRGVREPRAVYGLDL